MCVSVFPCASSVVLLFFSFYKTVILTMDFVLNKHDRQIDSTLNGTHD